MNKRVLGAAVVVATVAFAGGALAQEAGGAASTSGDVGMTLPGAGAPAAAATQGESDHDAVVGRFGVGYLGSRSVAFPDGAPGAVPGIGSVQAPVVGLRYWIDQMIGLDAGIGFSTTSGSTNNGTTTTDDAARTGVMIHAGLPLALAGSGHFSFQLVPEVNVGFSTQNIKDPLGPGSGEIKNSGTTINIGARAGAEIHFGFMGIPQLSLQGSVGVGFRQDSVKIEAVPPAGASTVTERTTTTIATTVNNAPWDIFNTSVAALYYF
jgi:hypothetical protein